MNFSVMAQCLLMYNIRMYVLVFVCCVWGTYGLISVFKLFKDKKKEQLNFQYHNVKM